MGNNVDYRKVDKICPNCSKKIRTWKKYCSQKCYFQARAIKKRHETRSCKKCQAPFEVNLKMIEHGWGKGIFCSRACHNTTPKPQAFRDAVSRAMTGNKHPNWKGGIMKGRKERNHAAYKDWRLAVFSRDHYTCIDCGIKNGLGKTVELHAHHLKSWLMFPEQRYLVENGVTLCADCHDKRHKRKKQEAKSFNS